FILSMCLIPLCGFAQSDSSSLLAHIDEVTDKWNEISEDMSTYRGLQEYCRNPSYKSAVLETLNGIHHYDTVIYNVLVKKNRFSKSKEIQHALKDIKKFETKYSPRNLIEFLHEECRFRRDIEKNKDESKTSFGAESYDGQITILETELQKYVKHVTKLVAHINKHSHHLHLEKYSDE
ncbi:MAG: hypothetical protein AAFO69_18265, partial [Bacteroidota bacterium]